MEQQLDDRSRVVALTADLVAAYVGHNVVRISDLEQLMRSVHSALVGLGAPAPELPTLTPPVSIKKSITPGYLISLEDGRQYKTLRRHLTGRGLTPDQYRAKWGLPADYPMVAPSYAKRRSELARSMALGRRAASQEATSDPGPEAGPAWKKRKRS